MASGGRGVRLRTSLVALTATACVALVGVQPAAGSPEIPCRSVGARELRGTSMDIVQLRTFTVEVKPLAKGYKIGRPAQFSVTVTRPAHKDPLQVGPDFDPPASAPAAGASVGVGVHVGEVFVPGFAITGDDGTAIVTIKLPSYMKPGPADIDGYAWKVAADSPCLTIEEDCYVHLVKAFTVTH